MTRLETVVGVVALLVTSGLGCTVGSGSGDAAGPLFVRSCGAFGGPVDVNDPSTFKVFDLDPSFFAGEPVEDIREGEKTNRLMIRLQRDGGGIENSDTLFFDVVNSREVARCVRGRKLLSTSGVLLPDYDARVCYWPSPEGPARLRVGPTDYVRAHLAPYRTCRSSVAPQVVVGTAVPCTPAQGQTSCPADDPDSWESFLEVRAFGAAVVDPDTPPTDRPEVEGSFKVDFGGRIWAPRFRLTVRDDQLIDPEPGVAGPLRPDVLGTMEGFFDFDLERGRAVQTFP